MIYCPMCGAKRLPACDEFECGSIGITYDHIHYSSLSYESAECLRRQLAAMAEDFKPLQAVNDQQAEEIKRLRAVHESELGVCQKHCDVVKELREALTEIASDDFSVGDLTHADGYIEELRDTAKAALAKCEAAS